MSRYYILALLLCVCAAGARAQSVRGFNADHDISSSLVNNIYQDRSGMIWIATENGLNRYDGNKFTIYRNIPGDSTSLCNNFVKSLFEDADGRLYVCTRRGMQLYDATTDAFRPRMRTADGKDFAASVNQAVRRNDNEYWVLGDSVKMFRIHGEDALKILDIPQAPHDLRLVHCGVLDPAGNIWLSKNQAGLYRIATDNTVRHYYGADGDPVASAMTIGKDGLLYIGSTTQQLLRFNSDSDNFEPLAGGDGKEIKSLFADVNGDIVQAVDGNGIIIYTPATGVCRQFRYTRSRERFDRDKTHCAMRDADGNIWIGIYQSGIIMIPTRANAFGYIGSKSADRDVIGSSCISAIFRDHEGTLWVGADNDGIYALDRNYRQTRHLVNDDIASPMCIFEDSHHNLWVGTYNRGVGIMDRSTGHLQPVDIVRTPEEPATHCFAITEDRDHSVWLGMLNSGLIRYDLETGHADMSFSWRKSIDPWIAALHYSPKTNALYVGTYSGLQTVSNVSLAQPEIKTVLRDDIIYSIDEDADGNIWLGTTSGIVCYDPATGDVSRPGFDAGLLTNSVYAVRCEGHNVWMSLNTGLTRYNTETGLFAGYMVDDGLQGNEFYKNTAFRDDAGELFFGGPGGITHFNPHSIDAPGRKWKPRIVGFYLHGTPSNPSDSPVHEARRFSLGPDENSFSVEFGTREMGRPESVIFAYSLDGRDWERLPAGTYIVNFHNLESGTHRLAFKTIDNGSESAVQTVTLRVAAPWFATPWAKALYVLTVLLIAWFAARNWRSRMRHKAELLKLTHTEQINEARLQSFVNISHEIRTPMSLVISPLQKLLATDSDPSRRHEYGLILRNAKRILRHIDELMDLRKIEKRQMRLQLERTPLVSFINDLCETFAQVTAGKKISLVFNYASPDIEADIDPANFDKVLMNLLSNAVKYTPEGGRISIVLSADADAGTITISVTDTGIGVPDKDKERIFDRFYQAHGNQAGGTGVGLHLTKQLVELHGGTISVTDNPDEGAGSRFTVTIPAVHTDSETDTAIPGAKRLAHGTPFNDTKSILLPDIEDTPDDECRAAEARVLVAEDDEEIRNYLCHELSSRYRVTACSNGREALDFLFRQNFDLVVSDVMMPVMDGLSLTRAIKQNITLNHIPVILVTALTRDEDNISAIEAGADDYITKPFNIEIVRSKISALIARYRSLKNVYEGRQTHDDKIDDIAVPSTDEKLMTRIMAVINREMSNPELTVEYLAAEVGLSRVHLHRRLKSITNQSPRDFIRNTRLRAAATLLTEKRLSVAEAADLTGFNSSGSFTTSFKRLFGVTPSEYAAAAKPEEANS